MDDPKSRTSPTPARAVLPQSPATGATLRPQFLTKEERDAIFAAAAANMQPARKRSADSALVEWQSQIMEYHRNGFSPVQIRDLLRAGKVVTSERAVAQFIRRFSHPRKHAAAHPKPQSGVTSTSVSTQPEAQSGDASGAAPTQGTDRIQAAGDSRQNADSRK